MAQDAVAGAGGIPLSADILGRLLESSQEVLYVVALSPVRMLYATPSFARRMGLPGDFLSRGYGFDEYLRSVHPEDLARVAGIMDAIVASRRDADLPENPACYRLRTPEGGWRVIQDFYSVLRGPDGAPHTLIGNARDVSEQNEARRVLKEREARFRLLAENSRDLFFSMRFPEGSYEYISPSVERIFGISPQEFYADAGMLLRCIAPAWRETVRGWMAGIAQGRVADEYEFQVVDKSGGLRWLCQRQILVPAPDGERMLLQGVATDVTDLREARQALVESEARFRSLAENSRDAFFSFRLSEGRYEYISPRVADIFGHSPQEFYDDPGLFLRCVAPSWRETMAGWMAETTQGVVRETYEYEALDSCGRLRWIKERVVLVPAPEGGGMLLQGLVSDQTEEHEAREALRASEEHFRQLIEAWPEQVMFSVNLTTSRYEYVSPSMERVLGHAPREFYDDPGLGMRVVAPEWRSQAREWVAELRRGVMRPAYEFQLVHKSGERRWVQQVGVARPHGPGQDLVVQFTFRDVTEEHEAREALRASEELYRELADGWTDPVLMRIGLAAGRPVYASPSMERVFGHRPAEVCSEAAVPHGLVALEWRATIDAWLEENRRGVLRPEYEYEMLDAWGGRRWVRARGVLLNDGEGNPAVLQLVLFDITERKRMEEELAASEARYRTLHESMRDGVATVDLDGVIVEHNNAFRDMLGYADEEIARLTYHDITPERWHDAEARILAEQVFVRGYSDVYEKEYRRKDGTAFPVSLRTYLEAETSGRPQRLWAVVRDISDQKRAEEALRKNEALLEAMLRNLPFDFWARDLHQRIIMQSEESLRLWGDLGQGTAQRAPFDERTRELWRSINRRVLAGEIVSEERVHTGRNGESRDVHNIVAPIRDGAEVLGLIGISIDITERKRAEEALRESEERFRELVEGTQSLITQVDGAGRFTYVNPMVRQVLGLEPEDCIGRLAFEIVHPDDRDATMAAFRGWVADRLTHVTHENRLISVAGKVRHFSWSIRCHYDSSGDVTVIDSIARDITDQKRAEEALRESEERFRLIVETASEGIWAVDAEQRATFVNAAMARMLGYSVEEMLGVKTMEFLLPEDLEPHVRRMELRRAGREEVYERRFLRKDGTVLWTLASAKPLLDYAGRFGGAFAMFVDITERKAAEEALRTSEERYALALKGANDGIWDWDLVEGKVYYSDRWKEILGYRPEELPHEVLEWTGRIHPEDLDRVMAANESCSRGEVPVFQVEYRLRHKDGSYRWIFGRGAALVGASGRVVRMAGAHTDITGRKEAEEALLRSERLSRKLLESMHEGVWAVDADRRTTFVNERLCAMLGYASAEFMNMSPTDVLEWPQRHEAEGRFRNLEAGHTGATDYVLVRKDGTRFPAHVVSSPIVEGQGRFEGLVCGVVDLTERARMEHELRRNQARFEALHELSRLNPATEHQLAAFTLHEAIRLTESSAGLLFFVSEDGQSLVPKAWETGGFMAGGQVPSFPSSGPLPWALVLQNGQPLLINDFSPRSHQVPPGHPEVRRFLGVPALDGRQPVAVLGLTGKEEPYVPEDTLQITLLLDGMWREVRTRRDAERIRASLREKEALLHEVHHRVKNNLQVISSLMDMAGRRLSSGEARLSLAELRGKVQAMSLIHAQLQGAGSDRGISLERFVRALFHQLREVYAGGLDLSLLLQLGDLALSLDQAVPLGLALNETLTNVFKHACPPAERGACRASRVEIRAKRDASGRVGIEVEDNGPGLPRDFSPDQAESLGMKLMRGLVRHQLRGELLFTDAAPGLCVGISFMPNVAH